MPVIGTNYVNIDYVDSYPIGKMYVGSTIVQGSDYPVVTGGAVTYSGSYKIHTFTSNDGLTIRNDISNFPFQYFLLGAGGVAGANWDNDPNYPPDFYGGGGAAGVVRTGSVNITATQGTVYPVVVGQITSTNGGSSSFNNISASGGNAGVSANMFGSGNGGSNADYAGGDGASTSEYGGGGAGAAGNGLGYPPVNNSDGGPGYSSSFNGTSSVYGRGGDGGGTVGGSQFGGGGNQNYGSNTPPTNGIVMIKYQYKA